MTRPVPIPDGGSAPFWDGCHAHKLLAQKCDACGRWRWPVAAVCPYCRTLGGTWSELRGTGAISSYVVVHHATHPAFAEAVPYTIVFVALDEAPGDLLLTSNLIDCGWEKVKVGMRVEVTYDDVTETATLPLFRPAA